MGTKFQHHHVVEGMVRYKKSHHFWGVFIFKYELGERGEGEKARNLSAITSAKFQFLVSSVEVVFAVSAPNGSDFVPRNAL